MKRIAFLLIAVAAVVGLVAFTPPAPGHADGEAAPIFGVTIPPGYRDWKLISVAHEAGNNNDIRAILGNDTAIKAGKEAAVPGRHNHCPPGLEIRSVRGKQQSLWPCPVFRCRPSH
jgi:hypothetical protein